MKQRRTLAQLQLLCLGISDISVGVVFVWGAISSWMCDFYKPCEDAKPYFYSFISHTNSLMHTTAFNRSITRYIAYIRSIVMSGMKGALKIKNMTPCGMLTELVLYTLLLNILSFMVFFGLIGFFQSSQLAIWVVFASLAVLMVGMTSFIFYRFWVYRNNGETKLGNCVASDDFQKLAALVALVFCCCQVNTAVWWGYRVFTRGNDLVINIDDLWYLDLAYFGVIANSAANLFIYLLGSSTFRRRLSRSLLCRLELE